MKLILVEHFRLLLATTIFLAASLKSFADDGSIFIDLSQSHDLKTILDSGLKTTEWKGQSDKERHFSISKSQNVIVRLPGGYEIQQIIQTGSLEATNDGKLTTMDFYGNVLPTKEAYDVAVMVHNAFEIPLQKLEKWLRDNDGKGRNAEPYLAGTKIGETYPHLMIEVLSSMNELYPWDISLAFGWNISDREKGFDEKWGAEHNPRPIIGKQRISLDSPKGKIYDRKEAYREINAKQEELERQMREKDAFNAKSSKDKNTSQLNKIVQPKSSPIESKSWLAWLIVVIAATVSAAWLLLRKK